MPDLSEYRAGTSAVVEQLVGADRERVLGDQLPRVAVRERPQAPARIDSTGGEGVARHAAQEISQP